MQRKLYIIATTSRTGSSHLCRLLTSTRRLGQPAEYYNVRVKPPRMKMWDSANKLEYFQQMILRTSTANGVCGVKTATVAYAHLRSELGPIFDLLRPKYIWLRRRDALRQAISLYRATATDIWHWHDGKTKPQGEVPFDARRINQCRQQIEQANETWAGWFAENQIRPLQLWYEDVIADPLSAVQAICRQAGVDENGLPPLRSDLRVMRDKITETWVEQLQIA